MFNRDIDFYATDLDKSPILAFGFSVFSLFNYESGIPYKIFAVYPSEPRALFSFY